uniref:(northern house mosquito) hypothetical protein n=1 Tax=Culex pipiens TaxID=7175 RepID=A0A8D8C0M3_CULPI
MHVIRNCSISTSFACAKLPQSSSCSGCSNFTAAIKLFSVVMMLPSLCSFISSLTKVNRAEKLSWSIFFSDEAFFLMYCVRLGLYNAPIWARRGSIDESHFMAGLELCASPFLSHFFTGMIHEFNFEVEFVSSS